MNLYELQCKLVSKGSVTIPELQQWLSMSYKEAMEVVHGLQERGWLSLEPKGLSYTVHEAHCKLRPFRRSELKVLMNELDTDCRSALHCITAHKGATHRQIELEVRGGDDTNEALATLLKRDLVCCFCGRWYLSVSSTASAALQTMVRHMRTMDSPSLSQLYDLFDGVFDA